MAFASGSARAAAGSYPRSRAIAVAHTDTPQLTASFCVPLAACAISHWTPAAAEDMPLRILQSHEVAVGGACRVVIPDLVVLRHYGDEVDTIHMLGTMFQNDMECEVLTAAGASR
jgi:hypothetical protein